MIKKVCAVALVSACSLGAARAQIATYKTLVNDPVHYKPTVLHLNLLGLGAGNALTMNTGVKMETVINGQILPWIKGEFSIYDGIAGGTTYSSSGPKAIGGLSNKRYLEAGTCYFFKQKEVTKDLKIVLSSTSRGRTTITRYTMIPGRIVKMLGADGGVAMNDFATYFGENDKKKFSYIYPGGTKVPVGSGISSTSYNYDNPTTMVHTFSVFAGLRLRRVTNLQVRVKEGRRLNSTVSDFYAHIMVAPSITITDVLGSNADVVAIVPESGGKKSIGWRVGADLRSARTCWLKYHAEGGQMPGVDSRGSKGIYYASGGVGITLAFGKKGMAE